MTSKTPIQRTEARQAFYMRSERNTWYISDFHLPVETLSQDEGYVKFVYLGSLPCNLLPFKLR